MKVSEYIPPYGLLFKFEYQIGIDYKKMSVNEMFENYPDFELTDAHIDLLFNFDLFSLQKVLKDEYFTPDNVTHYLRDLLDDFRQNGGDPLEWLHATFESVNMNPQNYRVDLITTIEKALIEWISIFEKLPLDYLFHTTKPEATAPTEQNDSKLEPEQPVKSIIFKDTETIDKINSELKGFFDGKETELLEVLQGNSIPVILLFPHNQNKFVEVFRRLKYNGYVLNNYSEIRDWICSTFKFVKNGNTNLQPFNKNTVYDILKGKGEPTKKERICTPDWLPHKSNSQLKREAQKEKL